MGYDGMKDRASHVSCETPCGWKSKIDASLYDIARFFSKVDVGKAEECWEWRGRKTSGGYGEISIKGVKYSAHRFSLSLVVGPLTDPNVVVRHKCDNRRCVNPNHLETGSHQENMADRQLRDRTARGQHNGRAKITEDDVRRIRADTRIAGEIAKEYGITETAVRFIRKRQTWGHVSDSPLDPHQ